MKKHKKQFLMFLLVLLLTIGTSCAGGKSENTDIIFTVDSKSYFSDFDVSGDNVYVKCHIALKNTENKEQKFNLSAYLPDDVKGGLLKNAYLPAVDNDNNEKLFTIKPNTEKEYDVVFLGEFAGNKVKQERKMPEIIIENAK